MNSSRHYFDPYKDPDMQFGYQFSFEPFNVTHTPATPDRDPLLNETETNDLLNFFNMIDEGKVQQTTDNFGFSFEQPEQFQGVSVTYGLATVPTQTTRHTPANNSFYPSTEVLTSIYDLPPPLHGHTHPSTGANVLDWGSDRCFEQKQFTPSTGTKSQDRLERELLANLEVLEQQPSAAPTRPPSPKALKRRSPDSDEASAPSSGTKRPRTRERAPSGSKPSKSIAAPTTTITTATTATSTKTPTKPSSRPPKAPKQARRVLSTAEKKRNHILSEKARRAKNATIFKRLAGMFKWEPGCGTTKFARLQSIRLAIERTNSVEEQLEARYARYLGQSSDGDAGGGFERSDGGQGGRFKEEEEEEEGSDDGEQEVYEYAERNHDDDDDADADDGSGANDLEDFDESF